ncbi:hypothetical protein S40285_08321 [Stachybotrys chlorohalonatus IBT 40285]|uniref:Uncharacterized protein n=1 Tax=Stachybotrys chlorohalonatus (strain IBT 40285) TaxID=1283841 RepID=A0A084QP39_STAC4|nr:hypothetical protein S40285_08321 [Stachybotrys chlorohalonata IBT 40285]
MPGQSGPDAAFGVTCQAGHATIDAIRAIQHRCTVTGASVSMLRCAAKMAGPSRLALSWIKQYYATNLNIPKAVLGGMITDTTGVSDNLDRSPIFATIIVIFFRITAQFPEEQACLENRLVPETSDVFMSVLDINV